MATPWNVGHPFLSEGAFPYLPIFLLTEFIAALLHALTDATLRHLRERMPTMITRQIKTTLRNVPRILARFGLDLTIAGIATINGPGVQRRGRSLSA